MMGRPSRPCSSVCHVAPVSRGYRERQSLSAGILALAADSISDLTLAKSSSFILFRSANSIRPFVNDPLAHSPSAQRYAPRPGSFPVWSSSIAPAGVATMRTNCLFGALLPQTIHFLSGTCRTPRFIGGDISSSVSCLPSSFDLHPFGRHVGNHHPDHRASCPCL